MRKIVLLAASALSFGAQAGLTVSDCVIREPAPGKDMTALYLNIHFENTDEIKALRMPANEDVVGAEVRDLANIVELHTTQMADGVMKMRRVPKIKILEGDNALKPGGNHIMLKGLKKQPKAGDVYPVTVWMTYTEDLQCDAVVKSSADIAKAQEIAK
ncbi:copper chaperone PCu(A)C [Enterovibrio sp. ZSDZ35]|uniref:Copper chaperone PCu(A)C n=1 Tax=Enterovibrio qingdaonensis TaxID=2899818 RepID=A0ABT5QKE2_9GAMM|nr:copper chaperone PCu(A)C [Enterovibrio sp. ZSDZ35]MDD1781079.1 copper chaperone PCu(A)C [Enterovibrio sp. ZSDZ35]